MDIQDWMKAQYNTYFSNKVSENETPSAVKSYFLTDMSMDGEKRMNMHYNTNSTHTTCGNYRTAAVKSEFSAAMSMDVANRMNTQYNTNFTHTVSENEANCVVDGTSEFSSNKVFESHKDLTDWVKTKGRSLGYAIVIRSSRKEENGVILKVVLMCNRGGIDKSKNSTRNKTSKKINCPFRLVGEYSIWDDGWTLHVICEKHNHEPALDVEGHPHATRLSDRETRLMDVANRMNTQYNTNFTHTVSENDANCVVDGTSEFSTNKVFKFHEDLTDWVKTKGRSLGYAIVIRSSRKEENGVILKVVLMCNRGGIDKSKNSTRNKASKKINCPFRLVGDYSIWDNGWTLHVICEKHNHEPALDTEGHPHAMRLSDKETRLVVRLLRKGLKPRAILSILKEQHPDNLSTIKTIYNVLQKFRKTEHAELFMGDMVNDEESVSPSPDSTSYTFDAKRMKKTVDHTNPFAVRNLVQGFDSAKHGSVTGQIPMPCFRTFPPLQTDLTQNPVKEISNANLVRDMFMFDNKRERQFLMKQFLEGDYAVESRDKGKDVDCDLETNKKHEYVGVQSNSDMEKNESPDVNFDGFADNRKDIIVGLGSSKSTNVKDQLNTRC